MDKLYYDLHIHSCLSPCGDDDMTPANIVGMAKVNELDVIAITDHNSCKNCKAGIKYGQEYGIMVIPGMELTTIEEVHVLCLFQDLDKAMKFNDYVYSQLIKIRNKEEIFGKQEIYNEDDQIIGLEENLLINATNISFDQVPTLMKDYGGIMVAAHIDKASNSVLSNLGFIPDNLDISLVEFTTRNKRDLLIADKPLLGQYNYLINSDAHYLHQISRRENYIKTKERSIKHILKAIEG